MMNNQGFFCTYEEYNRLRDIQGGGGNLVDLGDSQIQSTLQLPTGNDHEIISTQVLHCSLSLTNLVSTSCPKRNGFYLFKDTKNVNRF